MEQKRKEVEEREERANLDKDRASGMRPNVVAVLYDPKERKVLLGHKKCYSVWEFPQGGVDNEELKKEALRREISEETGIVFEKLEDASEYSWKPDRSYHGKSKPLPTQELVFSQEIQGTRHLQTDAGVEVKMRGKRYYPWLIITSPEGQEFSGDYDELLHWATYKNDGGQFCFYMPLSGLCRRPPPPFF